LLTNVLTTEPEMLQIWNGLAYTPNLWYKPKQIRDLEKPKRTDKEGQLTDTWLSQVGPMRACNVLVSRFLTTSVIQLELGYFSTDDVVRTFPGASNPVLHHNRKIIALDMEAYHFYNGEVYFESPCSMY
jgi:hypothetical protein